MRRFCLLFVLLLAAGAAGCDESSVRCGGTGCTLHVPAGQPHQILDGAEVVVREVAAGTALVDIDGDSRAIVAGTTGAVGGLRVTVVSIDGQTAHLLVAP